MEKVLTNGQTNKWKTNLRKTIIEYYEAGKGLRFKRDS